jgi:conjugative relaxase-like TrwC/TraI family protein
MLSMANVRSAGGAATYFAADNYYAQADADRSGEWFGDGAERLGLEGQVEAKAFEALLRGELPDGARVGQEGRHRAGTDLTFSMPKSWSLIALVGGDTRILEAYRASVKEALGWAERNGAETRMEVRGNEKVVATGNLAVALFQHDTNRNQEPNAHVHAVVANVTQGPDGNWRALRNDKLWEENTLLNAIAMARFREKVEALGYRTTEPGKHGNFEAEGISRETVMAFSTRRAEVLEAVATMRHKTPEAHDAATLMTRAKKDPSADRDTLRETWAATAKAIGFDATAVGACGARRIAFGTRGPRSGGDRRRRARIGGTPRRPPRAPDRRSAARRRNRAARSRRACGSPCGCRRRPASLRTRSRVRA